MNQEKIGQFILELRKLNHMTQKDLAAKLNITDKAVSKWERGLSCPDISLLSAIADLFGITTGELLNGERNGAATEEEQASIEHVLRYADKAVKSKAQSIQKICAAVFSFLLFLGIAVCAVCDLAISGTFTWSLIPISSIVFAWLVFFPVIRFGGKGIVGAVAAFSILIVPFLYALDYLIQSSGAILLIGTRMAGIAVAFVWIVFALFKLLKGRKLIASAISLLLAIPMYMLINVSLSRMISERIIDVWDILAFSIIGIASLVLLGIDFLRKKNRVYVTASPENQD